MVGRRAISLGFTLSMGGLVLVGCDSEYPAPESLYIRELSGEVFDTTPVRGEFRPLRYRRGSFEYRCTECHNDFSSPRRQQNLEGEHADIDARFDHGLNTYCVNCHHQTDRNSYVDHDGSPIPSSEPAKLCAKCHGPTYRDWQAGVHGRLNGSWLRSSPERTRLLCIQCHDPHAPKFAPMVPDPPAPRTRFETADSNVGHDTHEEEGAHEPGT